MTFFEALERTRKLKENVDDAATSAIFTGKNVAEDFWDNFILVCNNKDGVAALLGVPPDKVANWPQQVQEHLDKTKDEDNPEAKEKTSMINTGDSEEL